MNIIKKVFYRLQFLSRSERKLKPATNNENALAEKLRNDMTIEIQQIFGMTHSLN